MTINLIHITPELPPAVGGVADYTSILSHRLVEMSDGSVEPALIHAGKASDAPLDVNFPVVDRRGQQSADVLADAVRQLDAKAEEKTVVLLEYSGYGYANHGAPRWLAQGLGRVCGNDRLPLLTMFHELYATGAPWTTAFWVSPVQRLVAARLARMSSGVMTNRPSAVPWLRRYRASEAVPVHVQPVFSNIGEPDALPAFSERARDAVVFGGGGRKAVVYDKHRDTLQYLIDQENFCQVVDIGPAVEDIPVDASWSQSLGVRPADDISDCLTSVSLGVLSYPGNRLGKSGVAAAFASHGVPFLLFDENTSSQITTPYVEDEHFWRVENAMEEADPLFAQERLAKMSLEIRDLYQNRLHSTHAARSFLKLIQTVTRASTSAKTPLQAE